ncbi:MAG: hypothetical protein J6Y78_15310 [Paludibacteraceae bacterium]|nr:hypothetical protein [Paludibacteraceae bacterium]
MREQREIIGKYYEVLVKKPYHKRFVNKCTTFDKAEVDRVVKLYEANAEVKVRENNCYGAIINK